MRLCSTGLTAEQKGGVSKGRRLFAALWQVLFWGRPFLERHATGKFCGRHRPCGSVIRQDGRSLWWRIFPGTCFQHLESRPVPAAQRLNRRLTTFSSASAPKFLSGRFTRACNVNAQVLCLPFFWQSALIWEWNRKRSAIVHPCRRHAAGFVQLRTPKRQCPGFCSTALNSRGSTVNAACPWAGGHGRGAGQDAARGSEGQMPARINACAPPCRRCSGSFASRISRTEA